jgi:hypothetical protein
MYGNLLHVNRQDTVKRNTILFRNKLHTQRGAFCLISKKGNNIFSDSFLFLSFNFFYLFK